MSNGNVMYNVVVYIGNLASHDSRVIYTTSKEKNAEAFLHSYCKEHPEVCKAFIEKFYGRMDKRKAKYMREDDED